MVTPIIFLARRLVLAFYAAVVEVTTASFESY